jgi:excisionase family DNA binding protein
MVRSTRRTRRAEARRLEKLNKQGGSSGVVGASRSVTEQEGFAPSLALVEAERVADSVAESSVTSVVARSPVALAVARSSGGPPPGRVYLGRAPGGSSAAQPGGPLGSLARTEDVAALLRVHPKTVERMRKRDGLPCLRIGGSVRYDLSDVLRWASARREGV